MLLTELKMLGSTNTVPKAYCYQAAVAPPKNGNNILLQSGGLFCLIIHSVEQILQQQAQNLPNESRSSFH